MIEGLAGDGAAPAGDADPVGVLEAAVEMLRGRWHPDLPGELALAETGRLLLAVERLCAPVCHHTHHHLHQGHKTIRLPDGRYLPPLIGWTDRPSR